MILKKQGNVTPEKSLQNKIATIAGIWRTVKKKTALESQQRQINKSASNWYEAERNENGAANALRNRITRDCQKGKRKVDDNVRAYKYS